MEWIFVFITPKAKLRSNFRDETPCVSAHGGVLGEEGQLGGHIRIAGGGQTHLGLEFADGHGGIMSVKTIGHIGIILRRPAQIIQSRKPVL